MSEQFQSSYFPEDRSKPLNPKNASLNESLQTKYIDLDERDDSMLAKATRSISSCVGALCTPRQVLGLLRVLKAITLSFIVLTILADLMYILFVEILSSGEVKLMAGGTRDTILRGYGIGLSTLGLAIELDFTKVIKKFSGLKGFVPRAFLYYFIAQITRPHPLMFHRSGNASSSSYQAYGNDDAAAVAGDDAAAAADDAYNTAASAASVDLKIPTSAVGFQRVTSYVL